MQVPADLASRLLCLAQASGDSPEALLREALSAWMETTPSQAAAPASSAGATQKMLDGNPHLHTRFVPQQPAFSVYE